MEQPVMRHATDRIVFTLAAALVTLAPAVSVLAQSGQLPAQTAPASAQDSGPVRRISVDDAVQLALEQNLGIQIERVNPRIQDVAVAQARSLWVPTASSTLSNNSTTSQAISVFSGGQTQVNDSRFTTVFGVSQLLPTGANYSVSWNNWRATSTNIFNSYNPQLSSTLSLNVTQPLIRNFKIDAARQQLELSRKDRDASDLQLRSTIVATTRNVKNAYWELVYQISSLNAAQQSLDLAKRVLGDNEKRVQIGTMAPIDIVEAQSEVARNEESVIIAQAAIKSAEDQLRALIYNPSSPDFWTLTIEPSETAPFQAQTVNVDEAMSRATANRVDIKQALNGLEHSDINLRYYRNQSLPDVSAQLTYSSAAAGGVQLSPITSFSPTSVQRTIIGQRGYGTVLGDAFGNAFPAWTLGVTISYPIGTSTADTNLARTKLQYSQSETQLKNLQLQVATQVREIGRQVQTNQKRVDTTRVARELAERRLEAAEKKFAAGIETSFFVFQAQRDLSTARTSEVRAISDYNKSLVDFEAVQQAPLVQQAPVAQQAPLAQPAPVVQQAPPG
jgi:outer membrane protein